MAEQLDIVNRAPDAIIRGDIRHLVAHSPVQEWIQPLDKLTEALMSQQQRQANRIIPAVTA